MSILNFQDQPGKNPESRVRKLHNKSTGLCGIVWFDQALFKKGAVPEMGQPLLSFEKIISFS